MLVNIKSPVTHSHYRSGLKKKISASQKIIHSNIDTANANIIHRTQAINSKRSYQTLEQEQTVRQDILGDQIKVWRKILPTLPQKLAHMLTQEEAKIRENDIACLSPYRTEHIKRFGDYSIDMLRAPASILSESKTLGFVYWRQGSL
jgi:hypothetical protein